MIISDEQARLAAQYLRSHEQGRTGVEHVELEPRLLDQVRETIQATPETRDERVREARDRLVVGEPDSQEVAAKMISRIVSDSLR